MRVVFAISPGHGHMYPTFGLADALVAAGHHAAYAMIDAAELRRAAEGRGFTVTALPPTQVEQQERFAAAWRDIAELSADEVEREGLVRLFGPLVEPALDPLVSFLGEWRADLVVHELTSFVAPLAAAVVGLPAVNQGTGFGFVESALGAGDALAPMWRTRGLEPDPLAGIYRELHLEVFPPSLPDPILDVLDPDHVLRVQPVPLRAPRVPGAPAPGGPVRPPIGDRPLVVATLGTVFDADPHAWAAIDGGLGRLGVEVVRLARDHFVPIGDAVEGAAAVVAHGGAGTVLAALAAGVPLVLVPRGADQFAIADACVRAGVAIRVEPDPTAIADAVADVVGEGGFEAAARRIQAEIEAMAPPADVVAVLEQMVGAR